MSQEIRKCTMTFEIFLPVLLVPRLLTPRGLDLAAAWWRASDECSLGECS